MAWGLAFIGFMANAESSGKALQLRESGTWLQDSNSRFTLRAPDINDVLLYTGVLSKPLFSFMRS